MRDPLPAITRLIDVAAGARGALAALSALLPLGTLRLVLAFGAILALAAFGTLAALGPVIALRAFAAWFAVVAIAVLAIAVAARRRALLVTVVIVIVLVFGAGRFVAALVLVLVAAAALILLLEARAAVFQHAEIMVRELEVIFSLHAVAGKLHVARQGLVFLEQLSGIAALAIVLPIAIRTTGHSLGTLSTAAATATALTIVDQQFHSLSYRPRSAGALEIFPRSEALVPSR